MLQGSIVAIVTPFTESFEVDYPALENLVSWHIEEGTDGILCLGTTGEAPTLTSEEKTKIIETVVRVADKRVPVIVGTGSYNTSETLYHTKEAKELGADACLVVIPYYSRPGFNGCMAHFEILSEVGIPLIIYHHPGRTGLRLTPEELGRLSTLPSVIAIKEASADISYLLELRTHTTKAIFTGEDSLTLPAISVGAAGVFSIVANLIPGKWKEFVSLCLKKEFDVALQLSDQYYPLCRSLIVETNPQCIKYALSLTTRIEPFLRLPLVEPMEGTKKQIAKVIEDLEFLASISPI